MKNIWKLGRSGVAVGKRKAFTLIELLVVVSIILILMGISLRVMSIVNRRGSTARTEWILQQVKNALGSYYALYGTYPPVSTVPFIYEGLIPTEVIIPQEQLGWSTGLVYYIFSTDSRHNQEAAPWQHFLEGIGSGITPIPYTNVTVGAWNGGFTNKFHTLVDAWGRELRYNSSGPDYQRFILWSVGPNGSDENGGGDDIGVQWTD